MASLLKVDRKVPSRVFFLLYLQVCMNGTCHPHSILNYDCDVQKKCHGHGVSDSSAAGEVVLCCSVLKRSERLFPGAWDLATPGGPPPPESSCSSVGEIK